MNINPGEKIHIMWQPLCLVLYMSYIILTMVFRHILIIHHYIPQIILITSCSLSEHSSQYLGTILHSNFGIILNSFYFLFSSFSQYSRWNLFAIYLDRYCRAVWYSTLKDVSSPGLLHCNFQCCSFLQTWIPRIGSKHLHCLYSPCSIKWPEVNLTCFDNCSSAHGKGTPYSGHLNSS